MKKILAAMLLLLTSNLSAHDSGDFYVIPFPSDEIVEKEVCNGTPVGKTFFSITGEDFLYKDYIFTTTTGHTVIITGGSVSDYSDGNSFDFKSSPSSFPEPSFGVKGPYYVLRNGNIAYARFL